MPDRNLQIDGFLDQTVQHPYKISKIAGDASSRSYFRITSGNKKSYILMDAPPSELIATRKFIEIAQQLIMQGFTCPKVLHKNLNAGLILLSDLGHDTAAVKIHGNPNLEPVIASEIVKAISKIEDCKLSGLERLTPSIAGQMVAVSATYYANRPDLSMELTAHIESCFKELCDTELVPALRDFHAENVIWRSQESGLDSIGLLDFQDAFLAPRGYDFISYTRDVRRDVPTEIRNEMTREYVAINSPKFDVEAQFACLAVQRNLRIMGVFSRLAKDAEKQRYLAFLPRTWRYIMEDLQHDGLAKLRQFILDEFPSPEQNLNDLGTL